MAAARAGHAPTSVLIAAWEDRFIVSDDWGEPRGSRPPRQTWDTELVAVDRRLVVGLGGPVRSPSPYPTLTDRWAARLEAACRRWDRAVGERGAGLAALVADVYGWDPTVEVAGRAGSDHCSVEPASPAFFVARLVVRSKRLRRALADPYRERSC